MNNRAMVEVSKNCPSKSETGHIRKKRYMISKSLFREFGGRKTASDSGILDLSCKKNPDMVSCSSELDLFDPAILGFQGVVNL